MRLTKFPSWNDLNESLNNYIYEHKTYMDIDSYLPPLTVKKLSEFYILHAQLFSVTRHF